MSKGTPKSLEQAILNALDEPAFSDYHAGRDKEMKAVYDHVRDYLAQKFSVAMLNDRSQEGALRELFELCVRKKGERR